MTIPRRKMKAISVFAFLVLVVAGQGARDNKGTKFILTFTENAQRNGIDPRLVVAGTTQTPATVSVEVPAAGFQQTFDIKFGEVNTVDVPRTAVELRGSATQNTGIIITATDEIVVYGVFAERASSDAFLALPTDVLGTEYYVSCYNPSSNEPSQFGVVGIRDGTTVNIVPTQDVTFDGTAYTAGQTITVTLDRLQTLQVQSDADLTGSKITSDKKVGVLSGNLFVIIGNGQSGTGDHIVEMIPPVDTWGKEFVTVPLAKRTVGDKFRVIAARDNTQVNVTEKSASPVTLNAGEFWEFNPGTDKSHYVVATEPVILMQYSKTGDADNTDTDPFMLMIPPLQQFAADYTFATAQLISDPSSVTHHVNIAIRDSEKAGLLLDGNPLDPSVTWTPIPGTAWSGAQIDIADGTHTLVHTSPIVTFGISVYGFTHPESYGYPGGLRLAQIAAPCVATATISGDGVDNDCDGRIDEELANGLDDDGDGAIDEDLAGQQPLSCENDKDEYKSCVEEQITNCASAALESRRTGNIRARRAAEDTEHFAPEAEAEAEEFVVAAIAVVAVGVVMVVVMAMTYHLQKQRLLAA
ncbi:IgGFc-binding protein-like isoform X2 [Branchiostoma floridae]|uniref:IgGFc-binding protein-like isoform X2 n=1 Tax=Branchiostoma floridae TaxID=7739 RepID=A0A9J7KR89_BRAFL|nr:IgGFc-binding protein-like isoform X2 [Branchiostoma floridae]